MTKMFAAILKNRIAEHVDPYLHKTQYGFRKDRSTNQAIHIVRRLVDLGERTSKNKDEHIHRVLLDWEKAFDKIDHTALFGSMERMGIDDKLGRLTKQLYKNQMFCVEMDEQISSWKTKKQASARDAPYPHTSSLYL